MSPMWGRLAVALGAVLALASCSSGQVGMGPGGNLARARSAAQAQAALTEGGELWRALDDLQWRLILRCMQRQGFLIHPPRAGLVPMSTLEEPLGEAPSLEAARRTGYGLTRSLPSSDSAFDRLPEADQRRYWSAQTGFDGTGAPPTSAPGGCVHEAMASVFGPSAQPPALPLADLGNAADARYLSDRRIAAARAGWSSCMREAGFNGLHSSNDARQRAETDPVHEIALASADAACADRFGTRAVQRDVWHEVTVAVLADFEPRLVAYRDALRSLLAAARTAADPGG